MRMMRKMRKRLEPRPFKIALITASKEVVLSKSSHKLSLSLPRNARGERSGAEFVRGYCGSKGTHERAGVFFVAGLVQYSRDSSDLDLDLKLSNS